MRVSSTKRVALAVTLLSAVSLFLSGREALWADGRAADDRAANRVELISEAGPDDYVFTGSAWLFGRYGIPWLVVTLAGFALLLVPPTTRAASTATVARAPAVSAACVCSLVLAIRLLLVIAFCALKGEDALGFSVIAVCADHSGAVCASVALGIGVILLWSRRHDSPLAIWPLTPRRWLLGLAAGVCYALLAILVFHLRGEVTSPSTVRGSLVRAAYMCLLGPVWEELIFRYLLYVPFAPRLGHGRVMLVSAAAFALYHNTWNVVDILCLAGFGAFWIWLFRREGIQSCIVGHCLCNTILYVACRT